MRAPVTGGSPDLLQDCDRDLSVWLADRHCRKCNGDMKPSKAMQETYTGRSDFIGGAVVTMSPGGPGRLVDCLKCSICGWSISA